MLDNSPTDLPLVPGASLEQAASWFFESSSDGFALSKDRVILGVNRAWCLICRCTQQDMLGKTGFDLVHPDELADYLKSDSTLKANGVAEFEHRLPTGDGGWVWVHMSVKRGPDGYAMMVIHDLTAKRAKLDEIEDTAKSDELLRSAAGVITWRFNPDGENFISDAHFGSADDYDVFAGGNIPAARVAARIHPDDRQDFADALALSIATGEPGKNSYRRANEIGGWDCYRSSWRGLKRAESGKWLLMGIAQDITELVEARDAALDGERAAKQADDSKSEFVTNLSHEIRTPLNGVLGVLHLLAGEALSNEMKTLVSEGLASGAMLTTLLNDVLDLSMIEGDQVELAPEAVDAATLIGSVAQMFRAQIEAKGLYMRTYSASMSGPIWVDPHRLRQILINLVGNAAKFTARGGITIRPEEIGTGDSRRLRIEVEDTGVGIAKGAQGAVFERFFQVDGSNTRQFGGTGLGLAIARSLAKVMGGDIGVESQPGKGSTFWVEIAAPRVDGSHPKSVSQDILDGLRVLVVDDNATNRIIATKILQSFGAVVETAESGALGIKAAKRNVFDLIFMDIQMPGLDGVEATRLIRAMAPPAGVTPIFAMTANVMVHQIAQYHAAGMDGVVAKPLSPCDIIAKIANLVEPASGHMALGAA